jgi:menaquinone-dependent protoporphyrinogen IX oxidase
MKILVVYYSRTGMTKKIATLISTKLRTDTIDVDEIIDQKDRSGPIGYMTGGKDAMKGELTKIAYVKDPKDYDLIIIGGPVWAWTMCPAVRTYIDRNRDALRVKKVAFFATQGNTGSDKKFLAMEEMLRMKPVATLSVDGKDFRSEVHIQKVDDFAVRISVI